VVTLVTKAKASQIIALQHPQCRWTKLKLKHFGIEYLLVDLKKTGMKMALLLWKFKISIICSGIHCLIHASLSWCMIIHKNRYTMYLHLRKISETIGGLSEEKKPGVPLGGV